MTGCRSAAMRPAKPRPTGIRTPWLTSSSRPLAAVAISWRPEVSRSSTAGGQLPSRQKPVYLAGLPAEEPGVLVAAAKPPDNGRPMWHIGPAYDQQPAVLADLPVPMDLRLQFGLQSSAVRGRPGRTD